MKASVQFNDFIGTSAADISDHTNLNEFLSSRGVNIDRYEAIGASFLTSYSDFFSASIICIDNVLSTSDKKHIVKIGFEEKFDKFDFFDLFKRFNVVISKKYDGYIDQKIDEEIVFEESSEDE